MKSEETNDPVRNRMSWLWIGVIGLFSIVLGYKLIVTPFNLVEFRFNDLLSLLLAIFAIALSVFFYMKANDTATLFYDNTYKFTNVVSEILGRIEAGFGERLRHLDEVQSHLRDRFDRMPFDPVRAEKKVVEDEERLKEQVEERDKLLDDLARRAKLQDEEKQKLFAKLREQEEALSNTRAELDAMRSRLKVEAVRRDHVAHGMREERSLSLRHMFERELIGSLGGYEFVAAAPSEVIQERFVSVKRELPPRIQAELEVRGYIDIHENLTREGIVELRNIARRYH